MRRQAEQGGVTVRAVAGNHAIFFGLDLTAAAQGGCLGFAVHRTDHTENERYWLAGFKTFRSVVPVPDPKVMYSTRDHPLQTFYWGDYTAKPGHRYTYRFVPRYGKPKNLVDRAGSEATIEIWTSDPSQGTHGIYFNRGVAASQAYAQKFGARPDKLPPDKQAKAMAWLSRGLQEALLAFIGQARSGKFALRAAVYEFTQPDVLAAFLAAHRSGADVEVVYHAGEDEIGVGNRAAIKRLRLPKSILTARTRARIAHNKFIVFCRKTAGGQLQPLSVWTGSTNLSEGGIFGHSNVGHVVRDPEVAQRFLEFWSEISGDPELDALRDWNSTNSPFAAGGPSSEGIGTIFSPRRGLAPLNWYADRFGSPHGSAHITQAFGMGAVFESVLQNHEGGGLNYVLLEKRDSNQDVWARDRKVFVAVGSEGGSDQLARWAKERLTGFNPRVHYLHTKVLLVDPLSSTPLVVTGSANFSPASTNANDENMLVIPADEEVADVYFTELARIFNHFYARYWAKQLSAGAADADEHSFLQETDAWQKPYFKPGNPKELQRLFLSGHN